MVVREKGVRQAPTGPAWAHDVVKPRSLGRSMASLFRYMGDERRSVVLAAALMVVGTSLALIGPQFLDAITDEIFASIAGPGMDIGRIMSLGAILAAIYSASFLFSTAESYISGATSERVGDRMRRDLSRKFHRFPLAYLESHPMGDLMSRMTNDTDTVRRGSAESFSTTINAFFTVIGAVVMMTYTSWELTLTAVLPTSAGICILWAVTRRTQHYFHAQQRGLGRINSIVEEAYYGHDVVRAYDNWGNTERMFDDVNERLFQSSFRARFSTSLMPQLMHLVSNLSYVMVCTVGSLLILGGHITYGTIVAFIVYIKMFNQPVVEMADIIARMQSVASASERVLDLLGEEEMAPDPGNGSFSTASGDVEFRDVRFGYRGDVEVIHGLNLHVRRGSTVAIVGPTGAGKTTLVNLLMRFYDPDSGEILFDGVPISSLSREQVRSQFSMVLQDSWIFEGSVHDNVAFTSEDATREAVEDACRVVGIDNYIRSLPHGYDTVLLPDSGLSIGQRQQIAIARAIVKDAPMIILDEATSSVDTRTEKKIQTAMDRMTAGRTSFIIAHRLSTIRNADCILVMVDGEIVESGTHEELLERGGFYRMLHDTQFKDSGPGVSD